MTDIFEVQERRTYLSRSGIKFAVLHKAKHGQNCTLPVVVYTNLEPTSDRPVGEIWTMEESLFMKLFREDPEAKDKRVEEDYDLIRTILTAQYEKPTTLLSGTVNWAAYIAHRLTSWKVNKHGKE